MYNNTMISFNMLEVARIAGVKRFFYASSACIYPEYKQLDGVGLKEGDAWPAQPQDAYGEEEFFFLVFCCCFNWRLRALLRRKEGEGKSERAEREKERERGGGSHLLPTKKKTKKKP